MSYTRSSISAIFAVALVYGASNVASGQVSGINGPDGSTSAAMWFLGHGIASCCTGLAPNLYFAQTTAVLTNNSGDPTPTIVWSTDTPDSLQITPGSGALSATLTALAPSTHTSSDINVWATVDGVQTANLPIYINTPYSVSNGGAVNQASSPTVSCVARGYSVGYTTIVTNTITDRTGVIALTKIDLNETLEHQIDAPGGNWPFPTAGAWPVSSVAWTTNTNYIDYLAICATGTEGYSPALANYNTSTTTLGFSETQKFWIGSTSAYTGECAQINDTQLNTSYPVQTQQTTPGSTPTQQAACAVNTTILN